MIPQSILAEYVDSDWSVSELEAFGVCPCGQDIAFYQDRGIRYCPQCWEAEFPND